MRSSAWPFGKATFIRIILDILGSWRLVKTSAMNLYFTRWARAKQEYIIAGAMQISFDSPPWWWHHDIWYLRECNASSKLTVVTLSVNQVLSLSAYWTPLTCPFAHRPSHGFIWCQGGMYLFPHLALEKTTSAPGQSCPFACRWECYPPRPETCHENPRDSMSCGPSRLRRTMLVQSDLYNVKAPKFVGFIVESRHLGISV